MKDGFGTGAEALEMDLDIRVPLQIEKDRHPCAAELADDGGDRCAGGAGQCLAAVTEDEDRIQNDVDDCADQLADHAQVGAAGGRQQLFAHRLLKQTQTEHAADGQIPDALLGDLHILRLRIEIGSHAGQAEDQKDRKAAQCQKNAVFGGLVGALLIFLAQTLGQQGVDAHAGADAHGDHDVLQRERQRNGGQGALADVGHENRVHHVVEGLHQHGYHHRHAELDEQRIDVHRAHNVFPRVCGRGLGLLVFHGFSFCC